MILYILEVSVAWIFFYGLYHWVLRQTTFFALNRLYLLSSFVIGLVLPLLPPLWVMEHPDPVISEVVNMELLLANLAYFQNMPVTEPEPAQVSINWWLVVYWAGVVWMASRVVYGIVQIGIYFFKGKKIRKGVYNLVLTQKAHLPFSFLKWIFWGKTPSIEDPEADRMLRHEEAHIRQGHTFDVLLVELVGAFAWFSPLVYLYRKALRTNHEFLADAAVTKDYKIKEYGHLLIKQSLSGPQIALVNHLIHSQLKNRIIMMTKKRSTRLTLLRYTLALPLATLLLMAFSYDQNLELDEFQVLTEDFPKITIPDFSTDDQEEALATTTFTETLKEEASANLANEKVLSLPFLNTKNIEDLNSLSSVSPAADTTRPEPLIVINGKIMEKAGMDAISPDQIKSMNVLKGEAAIKKYGEKGRTGVVEIDCPDCNLDKVEKLDNPPSMDFSDKLILLNGVRISHDRFLTLKPEDITTIDVSKGKTAFSKYGEEGKNGVINITCLSCKDEPTETKDVSLMTKRTGDPLFVVNGVVIEKDQGNPMEDIKPEQITSINVWKDQAAIDKYGKKGENGVVEITCPSCKQYTEKEPKGVALNLSPLPLFIVNGEKVTQDQVNTISPKDIKSVEVLKDPSAVQKYGEEGKNGVIIIDCPKCKLEDIKEDKAKTEIREKLNVPTEIPSKVVEILEKKMRDDQPSNQYQLELKEFSATPNPTKGRLHLRFQAEPGSTVISIMDATGREIIRKDLQGFNGLYDEYIDLREAPKGLLLIQISQGNKLVIHKIVTQ